MTDSRSVLTKLVGRVIVALVVGSVGCSSSIETAQVDGTVTLKGKLMDCGRILFDPAPGAAGAPAIGEIAADGTFELFTQEAGDGVVPGKYYPTIMDPRNDERPRTQRIGTVQMDTTHFEVTLDGPNHFEIEIGPRDLKYAVPDD